jgi:hypothetical protein
MKCEPNFLGADIKQQTHGHNVHIRYVFSLCKEELESRTGVL